MMDLTEAKAAARKAAFARRKVAFEMSGKAQEGYLSEILAGHRGVALAGFMPIRTEIDQLAAMEEAAAHGPVGVPVIHGAGQALKFARWEPDCDLVEGPFKAMIQATLQYFEPEILIVPLVAFDRNGGRLGYGGGFYDRSLEGLRAKRATLAIGFAFAAQEAENLPLEATDQPLDMIVTERGIITV